ncbi:MAG: GTP-binding protein [Helicobacteraceae bacterium]|jgi:small GTP-binding protein|nr:GTP-binding protein [Helicobacteraceae bacterium]
MISKKVCVLGSFSVGKTSLTGRYVHSVFSDRYLSTIGVKISKKELICDSLPSVTLVIWDLEGRDIYTNINVSHLRGASGFFVVADGTRNETLDEALNIRALALEVIGADAPNYLLINKSDLLCEWEIVDKQLEAIAQKGVKAIKTSAKTGDSVNAAFEALGRDMLIKEGIIS